GHQVAVSWWSPIAYVWQDAAVVLVFAVIEWWLEPRERAVWAIYAALALYVTLNIPVVRVLSTPLTWFMWRAARGTLADSIGDYATWQNLTLCASVVAITALAPAIWRRTPRLPLLAAR